MENIRKWNLSKHFIKLQRGLYEGTQISIKRGRKVSISIINMLFVSKVKRECITEDITHTSLFSKVQKILVRNTFGMACTNEKCPSAVKGYIPPVVTPH